MSQSHRPSKKNISSSVSPPASSAKFADTGREDSALTLPAQPERERLIFAVAAFAVPMAVYMATLCRTIYWGDGIELTVAAHELGIPHPTGYPLFMILGKLAMMIVPFGEPAMRMNLMCAGFGAAAVLMMYLLLRRIFLGWVGAAFRSGRDAASVALAAALIFAFSRSQWFHSTTTEVYTLHIFLILAMFYWYGHWRLERDTKPLLWLTGLTSLALTHHTMAIFAAPLLALAWIQWGMGLRRPGRKPGGGANPKFSRKLIAIASVLLAAPFLFHLYLPVRAAAKPAVNWGNPATLESFLWVVTGGDFRSQYFMHIDPVTPFDADNYPIFFEQRLRGLIEVTGSDFLMLFHEARAGKLLIFLALISFTLFGLLYLSKADGPAALGLLIYFCGMIFFVFTYNVSDFGAFYYPLWALAWPVAALGAWMLAGQALSKVGWDSSRPMLALLMVVFVATLLLNLPLSNKARYRGASDYARSILDKVEPDAMIVTITDNDIYPLWYETIVQQRRTDVIVVGSNFLSSGWYESFFTDEQKNRLALPIQDRTLMGREQFYDLINDQLIAPNLASRPVYTTFFDDYLARDFRLEFISAEMVSDEDAANLDSFLPQPFLIRLHPLK